MLYLYPLNFSFMKLNNSTNFKNIVRKAAHFPLKIIFKAKSKEGIIHSNNTTQNARVIFSRSCSEIRDIQNYFLNLDQI